MGAEQNAFQREPCKSTQKAVNLLISIKKTQLQGFDLRVVLFRLGLRVFEEAHDVLQVLSYVVSRHPGIDSLLHPIE